MTDKAGTNPSGGVRTLLARFEAKSENTPPPSRGRSPASTERGRSTSSRPLSKVRTSFVAVERSGQMDPMLGVRKLSDAEMTPLVNGNADIKEMSIQSENGHKESPKMNGATSAESGHSTAHLPDVAEEEMVNGTKEETPGAHMPKDIETSSASRIASKDEPQESDSANASEASPLARKSLAVSATDVGSEGKVSAGEEKDVGSILKGSPFEEDGSHSKANGSPRKDAALKKSPAKLDSPRKSGNKAATSLTKKSSPSDKSTSLSKTITSRPTPISTKKESPVSSKGPLSAKSGESKSSLKVSGTPKTPSTLTSREPIAKTTSPRQTGSKSSPKPIPKSSPRPAAKDRTTSLNKPISEGSKQQSSRAPLASGTASGAVKPPAATGDPTKKTASASSKPRPKSPTRPVRLPAAATTSTAASAAKLEAPTSRSPSRAGATTISRKPPTAKKDALATKPRPTAGTTSADSHVRTKSSRPSLPPQTHDRPKSRTSVAPDEGFLARMMRPTAASASKVHEKVETKSPPRKPSGSGHPVTQSISHAVKPKRKSEPMGNIKEEGKDIKGKVTSEEKTKDQSADLKESEDKQSVEPPAAESNESTDAKTNEPLPEPHVGNVEGSSKEAPETGAVETEGPKTVDSTESAAIPAEST